MVTTDRTDNKLFHCPALTTIKVISEKWKTRILWVLRERPHNFNELKRTLAGVSAKVLTEQIAQLKNAGLIEINRVEKDGQTYSEFRYTKYGLSLVPALDALGEWGFEHQRINGAQDAIRASPNCIGCLLRFRAAVDSFSHNLTIAAKDRFQERRCGIQDAWSMSGLGRE